MEAKLSLLSQKYSMSSYLANLAKIENNSEAIQNIQEKGF